jgi:sulfatase maturation enzyme AslB (radical SAM superfamily)
LYLLHFPTNGWWPERVQQTAERALARKDLRLIITVSIDGPPVLHNDLRGRAESFARAVETLDRLRRMPGIQVFAGMTLGPRNVAALDATLRAINRVIPGFGPDELHVNILNKSGHYFRNLECQNVDGPALLSAIEDLKERRGLPHTPEMLIEYLYLSLVPRFTSTGRTPVFCQSLSSNCFVAADWTLYPCTIWDQPLLNLRDHDFDLERAWQDPQVRECRSKIGRKKCPNCWTPCEAYPSILGMGRSLLPHFQ